MCRHDLIPSPRAVGACSHHRDATVRPDTTWLAALDPYEARLVDLVLDALDDGELQTAAEWERYQTTIHSMLPDLRRGDLTVEQAHQLALQASRG